MPDQLAKWSIRRLGASIAGAAICRAALKVTETVSEH
jgi:hypothetical protein